MPTVLRVTIRGKTVPVVGGTKADIARALFEAPEGYSVSEVAKAIPMAYSQAHSIHRALVPKGTQQILTPRWAGKTAAIAAKVAQPTRQELQAEHLRRRDENDRRKATARAIVGAKPKVKATKAVKAYTWKGTCGNCGRPIEAKMVGGQNTFIHTAVDPTDYVREVQFCMAFPKFN